MSLGITVRLERIFIYAYRLNMPSFGYSSIRYLVLIVKWLMKHVKL